MLSGNAQTNISGVINSYAKVVTVDGADQVTLSDASAFIVGDTVLIIQMKGIEINVPNSSSFGSRQFTRSAGYFEFLLILGKTGNQITFAADMVNTYDAGGHVQLVRVRGFDNAKVTGTLTCDPWDPVTGKGGVVAMLIGNTLRLGADIDVSGKGFLGGSSVLRPVDTCYGIGTNYFFNDASTEGGYKGEGAASYHSGTTLLGTDYIKGRGAYFNGGGGGNGKYSGGSGGANGGKGGRGGNESVSCGTPIIIGGVESYSIPDNITYKPDKRIFMGGGGGAGTQLTGIDGTDGGNGGGIVIIVTDSIVGNNNSIISNGESVVGIATGDGGAGGGGAGGTILLEVATVGYKGSNLNLVANGGDGGGVTGAPVCTGPGGGGGGGIIWHSEGALPGEVSTSVLPGGINPGICASMFAAPGYFGEISTGLIVPLTGFLFNSIYSSRNGILLDTICEDDVPPTLLGTQPKGGTIPYTVEWAWSEDKSTWNVIGGEIDYDYTPVTPLTDTTYYRRTIRDNSVPQIVDVSKILTIIVQPKIQNYDITTHDTICWDTSPILLESDALGPPIGGDGSYSYIWEDSIDGGAWSEIVGEVDIDYQPPILQETTYYRRTTLSGIGCPKTSNVATITVLDTISNNNITSPDETICEGFEFTSLSATDFPVLSGGNTTAGDYRFEWIESIDGVSWNSAFGPNTNAGYDPDTLSAKFPSTTPVQYKRIVLSGPSDVCVDTSDVVQLKQWPKITDNTAPYSSEYCENDPVAAIPGSSPGGGDGTNYFFQWQQLNGTWSDIPLATLIDHDPGVLADSLIYRRIVTSNVCQDTSLVDTIPVNPALQNFNIQTISGLVDTTICFGQVPNQLVPQPTAIAGGDGVYTYIWDYSEDSGSNWDPYPGGTNEFLNPLALNTTTMFRRNVFSNVCSDVSNEITINILPSIANNTLTSGSSVCSGLTITITGSDPTGGAGAGTYTYYWEQSPDDVAWVPADDINDQKDYTSPALTVMTYYRRTVYSGLSDCCQDISASEFITINPLPTAALTPIDVTICNGDSQDLTFNLTGANDWVVTYDDNVTGTTQATLTSNTATETVTPTSTVEFTSYEYIIVSLVDGNGCIADAGDLTGTAKIRVDGPSISNPGPDDDICGLTYTMQAVLPYGSGTWTFPAAVLDVSSNSDPNKVVNVDSYGTHNFVWTVVNGVCPPDVDNVDITFYEAPSAADAGKDTTLAPLTTEINLYGNTPLVGAGVWTTNPVDAQAIISDPANPASLVTNLTDGENKFIWTISNGPCPVESDEVIVNVYAFKIPNGFSPNGDGINDFFMISGVTEYPNELVIISRQGTEVYRSVNYQNDWDGKYSSGDDVPDDTYYYILYYTKEGTTYKNNGWVIIKR